MNLAIYGSGGLGREVLDLAKAINMDTEVWDRYVFIDDVKPEPVICDTAVFTFEEFKTAFNQANVKIVIAVGEPQIRHMLRERVAASGFTLQALIHPGAFIGTDTCVGEGSIVQYGCFVSCNVTIGSSVLLQPNASVGHDSVIGSDAVLSTYTAVSGVCTIGERVYIGVSVPIKEHISIGADTIIGMGSVVLRDIPSNVVAIGNPARPMKNNENGRVFK